MPEKTNKTIRGENDIVNIDGQDTTWGLFKKEFLEDLKYADNCEPKQNIRKCFVLD